MIEHYSIRNFKIHEHTEVDLAPITFMTGMNGMGKSSVIQTLLLLRQSYLKGKLSHGIELNGDLCSVGTSNEVECFSSKTGRLEIEMRENSNNLNLAFTYPSNGANTFLKRIPTGRMPVSSFSIFSKNFQYLSAYRNGPLDRYRRDTTVVELDKQISSHNGEGEYVTHYLSRFGKNLIDPALAHGGETGHELELLRQVQLWLNEISPSITIEIKDALRDFYLGYKYPGTINSIPATGTGFGITYVLPILVAILSAKRGTLILLENPEAHLHPLGVKALTKLFIQASKAGIQIIIETHCERMIVESLKAVHDGIISSSDLSIIYFEGVKGTLLSHAIQIGISNEGCLSSDTPQSFYELIDPDYLSITIK